MANAIKCDECSTFADRPVRSGYLQRNNVGDIYSADKPDGWISVWAAQHPHDMAMEVDTKGEFCSWVCAATWLTKISERQVA